MRLLESHGISTDLYQAIVRMHQTLIFFFLNYPFTAWGVAASRAQHLAKSFTPSSIPTIPARMKTHITADSKEDRHRRQKTDTAARRHHRRRSTPPTPRRPTPPPEDIIDDTEEIDATESEKNEDTRRTITIILGMPRVFCIKHYPPTPPPSKQKQKQKQIQSNFLSQANTHKGTTFLFQLLFFHFFSIPFQNKGVTTGPLKFLCTQLHKTTLYPSTPYVIFVNIGSFPKSRLSQSKHFPFHPFKANQIKYSSTSCCRKLLSLFI